MLSSVFSKNGSLLPVEEAKIELDDIDFAYGYGVYETLKVRKGILYFPELHAERLFNSAKIIGLAISFTQEQAIEWLRELVRASKQPDSNIKVLLIGRDTKTGEIKKTTDLYMLVLSAFFPARTKYRDGSSAMLFRAERWLPQAKSLNMLASTIAFREAQTAQAYDAILLNRHNQLTEGTRTNLFYTDGSQIFTPPKKDVLEGVTMLSLQKSWKLGLGIEVIERALTIADLEGDFKLEGLFLSSTSTKLMPISQLFAAADQSPGRLGMEFRPITINVTELGKKLIDCYDSWLKEYALEEELKGNKLV